jgi:hypothetical protein
LLSEELFSYLELPEPEPDPELPELPLLPELDGGGELFSFDFCSILETCAKAA